MSKRKTGTREWASTTVNCISGCTHDCVYCYARYNAVDRFHRMTAERWTEPLVRSDEVRKKRPKYKGVVIFPSVHDITPEFLDPCMEVLGKLVAAGNDVLVVSKPHLECIEAICRQRAWREHITFRFTIGGIDNLHVWEPGAPDYLERKDALIHAHRAGWRTSVSAEPLLQPWFAVDLYEALVDYVTGEFWIGKLNNAASRITTTDPRVLAELKILQGWQTDEAVMQVVRRLERHPHFMLRIKWKDSYLEVLNRVVRA